MIPALLCLLAGAPQAPPDADVSLAVVRADGTLAYAHDPATPRAPGPALRVLSMAAALARLGPAHRFATEVYARDGVAYIKGYGDPGLTTADWRKLAAALPPGTTRVVLDDSAFDAYPDCGEASCTAFPVNGGHLALTVTGKQALPDPETPALPLVEVDVLPSQEREPHVQADLVDGVLRVVVHAPPRRRHDLRVPLGPDPLLPLFYAGQLFTTLAGVPAAPVARGEVPAGLAPLYVHAPRELGQLVERLLREPPAFAANQLLLATAPANPLEPLRALLAAAGVEAKVVEGSGADGRNRMSAEALARALLHTGAQRPELARLLPAHAGGRVRAEAGACGSDPSYALAGWLMGDGAPAAAFAFVCGSERCAATAPKRFAALAQQLAEGRWR